jgi:hypothetical protein
MYFAERSVIVADALGAVNATPRSEHVRWPARLTAAAVGAITQAGSSSVVTPRCGMATTGRQADNGAGDDMLNELRGRNLAHVGCTLGLTLGLLLGLVTALVIVVVWQNASATNWATVAWFGLTFALGVVGYWAGGKVSRRLWGEEMSARSRE